MTDSSGKPTEKEETKEVEDDHQKMYDEVEAERYDNGPISFSELAKMQEAREAGYKLNEMSYQFPQMVKRIFNREDVEDKDAALQTLADEFLSFAQEALTKESRWQPLTDKAQNIIADITKQAEKTEGGVKYQASDFAYVPDAKKPSTWKLRLAEGRSGNVTVAQLGRAAAAFSSGGFRGNQVQLPQTDIAKAKNRIRSEYRKLKVKPEDMPDSIKEASLSIWKEAGQYHWLAAYSNNYRDSDNPAEIISTDSHKEFDQALEKGEWPLPDAWLWHWPYPVGKTLYHTFDENTGFVVAGGVFNKEADWAAEGIIKAGWDGVSHGMPKPEIERDEKDKTIITRHRTREISFLPSWAAANKLSFNIINKELEMETKGLPAHKRPEFLDAFGEERVKQIEEEVANRANQAKEEGVEQKEETPPQEVEPDNEEALAKALTPIVSGFEKVLARLDNLDNRLKELEKPDGQRIAEKAANTPLAALEAQLEGLFSKEAVVDGRTTLAKQGPKQADRGNGLFFGDWLVGGNNVRQ